MIIYTVLVTLNFVTGILRWMEFHGCSFCLLIGATGFDPCGYNWVFVLITSTGYAVSGKKEDNEISHENTHKTRAL